MKASSSNFNEQLAKKPKTQVKKYIRPGDKILIGESFEKAKECTVSYGVITGEGGLKINGLLTVGHCARNTGNAVYSTEGKEIGMVIEREYGDGNGRDYAIVHLHSQEDDRDIYFEYSPQVPVKKIGDNEYETAPITGERVLTEKGKERFVYVYGETTGVLTGTITQFNSQITDQQGTIVRGLNKVCLENAKYFQEGDRGGPVYVTLLEGSSSSPLKVEALGHIVHVDNSNPQHKFFYYEPLNRRYNLITGLDASSSMPNTNKFLAASSSTSSSSFIPNTDNLSYAGKEI